MKRDRIRPNNGRVLSLLLFLRLFFRKDGAKASKNMKNILLMNKIASCGTSLFGSEYTVSDSVAEPVGMMVRSASLLETTFDPSLEAIARAGAGVNNIPVDRCAEEGIVVFNTPGANANAVKELALCALLLASRDVVGGIQWAGTLEGNELGVAKAVEKRKSAFGGCEISGKTLGIIGLGAIGRLLANAAVALGMQVVGCDPYLSDEAAKQLDPSVKRLSSFEEVYALSDYISLHVPATPQTKGMVNDTSIAQMKDGVRILNLARADLVDFVSLKSALASGKIKKYVTDFPTEETIRVPGIVAIPHLGASTEEAEDNCAVMAAKELIDFLENGNIVNSVNYPSLSAPRAGAHRLCVLAAADTEIQKVLSCVTDLKGSASACKKSTCILIDTDAEPTAAAEAIRTIPGVRRVLQR